MTPYYKVTMLAMIVQITVYSYILTRCIKNSNLRKEVGIAIKSKETRSQFKSVRNSYVAIMHQPVTVCSCNHVAKCMYK